MRNRPRALVYGDVDLNILDGSSVWAQSMVQALSSAGCDVRLLLKAPVRTTRLIDPLVDLPRVRIVRPFEERRLPKLTNALSPFQASQILQRLDLDEPADLVVVRGRRAVTQVVADGNFTGRLWTYLTDIAQSAPEMTGTMVAELSRVAEASRYLLCQTEGLRGLLETWVPAACGKCVLYPPCVPEPSFPVAAHESVGRPVRLVYTGKYAPLWNTLPMTELPAVLAKMGTKAELHMVGDKIHRDPAQPDFYDRMARALETAAGVVHHGGLPRQETMQVAAGCDLGVGWRSHQVDSIVELSTKLLEFGMVGLPVVVNRNPAHEELLGPDYPLFVSGTDTVHDVAQTIARAGRSPELYRAAAERCHRAAADFTIRRASTRLRSYLDRALPSNPALAGGGRPLRLVVAGHDLKFFTRILEHFEQLPEIDVRVDAWPTLTSHDPTVSKELANWADVVVVEWCGPAAIWYSEHKRPGSRLVVRLHRFELYTDWPGRVKISAVDRIVCVSKPYAALTQERTGWPADKLRMLPNWVDVDQLDRPKSPGAQYRLGMIGIAPSRKRFDRAVEVLARLRARDPRWQLSVKSQMPWDMWWVWNKPDERAHYNAIFDRIRRDPDLVEAVVFDGYGPDVGGWLRRIGYVLSTSDDESFHLAPAEGMASGAVPALLPWPGAEQIYDSRWIHQDAAAMADAIAETTADGWDAASAVARDQVRTAFDLDSVLTGWTDLLVEVCAPPARAGLLAGVAARFSG